MASFIPLRGEEERERERRLNPLRNSDDDDDGDGDGDATVSQVETGKEGGREGGRTQDGPLESLTDEGIRAGFSIAPPRSIEGAYV